jgi:hypothetical protein
VHDDLTPIHTAHLFRPLHAELIALLRGLTAEDWIRPAGTGTWSVRDTASHMLDGDLRRISVQRDAHVLPLPRTPIDSYDRLLDYLNGLNAQWIAAADRISPRVLTDLLEISGLTTAALMENSDPDSTATFPVAWAGQDRSPMWLDIGREYTERWHHQDQIRDAVGADPLTTPDLLKSVIGISLFAVPHHLADIDRADGTRVELRAAGAAGGRWQIERSAGAWTLAHDVADDAAGRVTTTDLNMARLLMHRLTRAQASALVRSEGDQELVQAVLRTRAVMV